MDNYLETDLKIPFKRGMTLSQYIQEMKSDDNEATEDQIPENAEDLYQTSFVKNQRNPSIKLIPFNIPEMDEDNYESEVDLPPETPVFQGIIDQSLNQRSTLVSKEKLPKRNEIQITTMYNKKNNDKNSSVQTKQLPKDYRIKNFSNSPFKKDTEFTPTKTNLAKTLYGNTFISNSSPISTASSTLYQNKLGKINSKLLPFDGIQSIKGAIHSRNSKEKYFQQKNKMDIDNLIQYENNAQLKFNSKINILDIRVDGLKDKLYERKNRIFN